MSVFSGDKLSLRQRKLVRTAIIFNSTETSLSGIKQVQKMLSSYKKNKDKDN